MGDRTRTSPVRFSGEFETRSPRKPSRPGPGDWHGPHWVAARRPRASQSEFSPAHQAQDLPGYPDFRPVLLWFRGRLAVQEWFGRTRSRDSLPFSGPYGHSPLTLASTLSSPLRENPAETMTFLLGLRRFGFCGQEVAVLLHSVAGPVFPVL